MTPPEAEEIVVRVCEIVAEIAPGAGFVPMYGGTMFELTSGDPASRVGGVFAYSAHVSVEFSKGVALDDPGGLLEGGGQARRHLKLRALGDVDGKGCAGFLTQAAALWEAERG